MDTLLSESTAIYDVIGQYPKFIRFPTGTGSQGSPMVAKVLEKLGFVETPYNVDATVITTFSLRLARDQMYKSYQNAFAQTTVQTSSFIGIHRDPFATEVQTSPLDLVNITGGFPTVITQLVNQVIKPVGFSIVDINQCLGLIQSYRDKNEGYKVTTTEAPKPVTGKEFQPTGNGLSEVLNECNGPLFAFTFDQGPTFTSTSIIKAFDAVSQKASFHISTNRLGSETLVKVVQNAMQNGHLIGLRFPVCLTPSQMSNDAIVDALLSESQAFYEKFNRYPKFLRLPLPTDDRLSSIAQSLGMVVTGASFDSKDYQKLTGSQIENNLMNKIAMNPAAGLISLHQDLFAIYNDQKFVQRMIKLAQTGTGNNYTKGLTVVTLDTCVGETGGYRADNIDPRTGNSSTIKIAQLCEPVVYGSKGVSDAFSVQISAILTALSICLSVLFIKSQ